MAQLYPIFLKLRGKTVLLVGGGNLALHKWHTLQDTGARVLVVAPTVKPELERAARQSRLTLIRRAYQAGDLDGADLVYAATDDPELNRKVYRAAGEAAILANAVDDPEFCDFYTPSVFRREALTLAISTAGNFPGLSKALREALEAWLPGDDGELLLELFALRRAMKKTESAPAIRGAHLRRMLEQFKQEYLAPTALLPAAGDRRPAAGGGKTL